VSEISNEASYVGTGIDFPMTIDHTGSLAFASGAASIERSIRMILGTAPGERAMRPDFGCAIWDLMFESINTTTLGLMAVATREALSRWEPRIEVDDVEVIPDDGSFGAVRLEIAYRVKATNDHRNLVFPFYAIPGEGDADIPAGLEA
jgi:phage baseplate assembly protein W